MGGECDFHDFSNFSPNYPLFPPLSPKLGVGVENLAFSLILVEKLGFSEKDPLPPQFAPQPLVWGGP